MHGVSMRITPAIERELDRLYKKHGRLTEDAVVERSKSAKSPLHTLFLWDDESRAAHIGRLEIARTLIMRVTVTRAMPEAVDVSSVTVRKYHGRLGGGYIDISDVATQEDMRQMLLRQAAADVASLRRKYEALAKELGEAIGALEELIASHVRERSEVA